MVPSVVPTWKTLLLLQRIQKQLFIENLLDQSLGIVFEVIIQTTAEIVNTRY